MPDCMDSTLGNQKLFCFNQRKSSSPLTKTEASFEYLNHTRNPAFAVHPCPSPIFCHQEDKSELIIIESGEERKAELQGEMDGNTLVFKAAAEDEAGTILFSCDTMRLSLLDDGKLCFEPESDGSEEETSETDGEDFSVKTYFDKIDVVE